MIGGPSQSTFAVRQDTFIITRPIDILCPCVCDTVGIYFSIVDLQLVKLIRRYSICRI